MRTVIAGASFKPPGHSPQVGKSFQPRQTLSVLAARAAVDFPDALFGCLVWLHHSVRDRGTRGGSGRPCAAPKTTREGLNHTFVRYARSDTLARPLRTRLQFIRQAFPASAEKQTDSSLLLPPDWCLSCLSVSPHASMSRQHFCPFLAIFCVVFTGAEKD